MREAIDLLGNAKLNKATTYVQEHGMKSQMSK